MIPWRPPSLPQRAGGRGPAAETSGLSTSPPAPPSWSQRLRWGDPSADLVILFRSLATLQAAGVHIVRSLEVLARQLDHPAVQAALQDTLAQINGGMRLSRALGRHPYLFKPLHLQMITAGENSGALHKVLEHLADHAEKSYALTQKLRSAMTYPALIGLLCLGLLVFLPGLVFKDLLRFLADLHVQLPAATRLLLFLSNLVTSPVFLVLLAAGLGGLALLVAQVQRSPALQEHVERLTLAMPGLGAAMQAGWVAEFSRSLAYTYGTGIPILQAMEISGQGRSRLLNQAIKVARTQMQGGEPLHRCLRQSGLFPPMAVHLIQAGEESGYVADMLERVANACEELVDERLALAAAMLQPLVLLVVGLVVGFMVIAVMSPMLSVLESL